MGTARDSGLSVVVKVKDGPPMALHGEDSRGEDESGKSISAVVSPDGLASGKVGLVVRLRSKALVDGLFTDMVAVESKTG
jgi:hypothetical protein